MKNLINKTLTILLFFSVSNAFAVNLCDNMGYTVGFFNGVNTNKDKARQHVDALASIFGSTYKGEEIQYEVFYNTTEGLPKDLLETYIQKLIEYGMKEPEADEAFSEFFWTEPQETNDTDTLAAFAKTAGEISEKFSQFMQGYAEYKNNVLPEKAAKAMEELAARITQEETKNNDSQTMEFSISKFAMMDDYSKHYNRLKTLLTEGQKVILVAHSQGNFFASAAYDNVAHDQPNLKKSMGVAHIAPPISNKYKRGGYVLNSEDWIIKMIKIIGFQTLSPTITYKGGDLFNHGFQETYLMPGSDGKKQTIEIINNLLANLKTPDTWGNIGSFTVTLTWDGQGDVDLYIDEPDGTRVAYYNKNGGSGYLDVDNTEANGPEHYFATCLSGALQSGTYRIGANNFARANGKNATIQIATGKGGMLDSKTLPIAEECGSNCNIINFFNLNVSKTQDGNANITVK